MRVTEAVRFDQLQRELGRTTGELAKVSEKLSSGRAINRFSDDPELAVQANRLMAEDRAISVYAEAAENAKAWLGTQDTALQSSLNVMKRARELTISAGTALSNEAREGIAIEIEALRDQLVTQANTTFNGRPVFGGFGSAAVTQTGSTVTFVGDGGEVQRRLSEDRMVTVNVAGSRAFGFDAGDDVFSVLTDVADHIRTGDTASLSGSDLDRIAASSNRISEALGSIGARTNQVTSVTDAARIRLDDIREYRSSIVDADLAETALQLTIAETAYESVLAATARLQLPSLVDYLR